MRSTISSLRQPSRLSDIRVRRKARLAGERPIRVLQFTGSGSVWKAPLAGGSFGHRATTLPGQRPTSHMPKLLLIKEKQQRKKQLPNTQIELSAFFFRTPCPSSRRPSCSAVVPLTQGSLQESSKGPIATASKAAVRHMLYPMIILGRRI